MSKSIKLKNNVYLDGTSVRKDIIYCKLQSDVQLTAGAYIGINNLTQTYKIGNKLSITNGQIKIGKGINYVKVSVTNGQIKIGKGINYVKVSVVIGLNCYDDTLYSYLYKNNANYGFWLVADTSSPYDAHSREEIIPVSENDLISFSVYLANGGSVSDTRTNIIVEAIG